MNSKTIATPDHLALETRPKDSQTALRFITCGSVDDGKSTLIGRLLLDSRAVHRDQLDALTPHGAGTVDLARLTDGLAAEREQGITIDVAWRYFSTPQRSFIIGDSPGHEQYTRNMVTAASNADAAVLLIDATKLDWERPGLELLPQTRRHALLCGLLRVPHCVYAINKLDAVSDPARAHAAIAHAIQRFTEAAGLRADAVLPISAREGWNVVTPAPQSRWCGHCGPTLLQWLERAEPSARERPAATAFAVQWVEPFAHSAATDRGRRVLWGRLAEGVVRVGQRLAVFPGGEPVHVVEVLSPTREPLAQSRSTTAGVVLDREVDISRGDWLLATTPSAEAAPPAWAPVHECRATLAWMDTEPLQPGRSYWALHGHRWVKARVRQLHHRLDIRSLQPEAADTLAANALGEVTLQFQQPLPLAPYAQSRSLGALILVDTARHSTAAAALVC